MSLQKTKYQFLNRIVSAPLTKMARCSCSHPSTNSIESTELSSKATRPSLTFSFRERARRLPNILSPCIFRGRQGTVGPKHFCRKVGGRGTILQVVRWVQGHLIQMIKRSKSQINKIEIQPLPSQTAVTSPPKTPKQPLANPRSPKKPHSKP